MLKLLHEVLNHVWFGAYSDLAWAALRALVAICGFIAALAVSRARFVLAWPLGALTFWIALKVLDDMLTRSPGSLLTTYFLVSNLLWGVVLILVARLVQRYGSGLKEQP